MNEFLEIGVEPIAGREDLERALDKGREMLERDAKGALAQFSWPLLRSRLAEALDRTLSTDGLLWLAHGWSAARELRAFKDPAKYPPGKSAFLKLGKHKLKATLHPKVTIRCEGAEIGAVTFDVPITGDFNAVTLTIQDGAVTGFGGGECEIGLQIKYRDVDLSGKLPLKTIPLPGKHDFAKPIVIP